jgi:hypothetical protein
MGAQGLAKSASERLAGPVIAGAQRDERIELTRQEMESKALAKRGQD